MSLTDRDEGLVSGKSCKSQRRVLTASQYTRTLFCAVLCYS